MMCVCVCVCEREREREGIISRVQSVGLSVNITPDVDLFIDFANKQTNKQALH